MTVIDVDYITEDEKPIIRLFKKQKDSNKNYIDEDPDFEPYFYALPEESMKKAFKQVKEIEDQRIEKLEKVEKSYLGEPIEAIKIIADHSQNVPDLRTEVKELEAIKDVYESKIPFKRRYLIDKDVTPLEEDCNLKKLAFDIETFNDNILMASFANENYEKVISTKEIDENYVEVLENEEKILNRIQEIINEQDPDIIITYNGDEFDFPKLNERCEELEQEMKIGRDKSQVNVSYRGRKRRAKIKGRIHTDLYPIVRRNLDLPSYSLENVYENVLKEEKPDLEWKEMERIWGNEETLEMKKLAKYSLSDSKATYEISEEFFPLQMEMTRLIGQLTDEISRSSTGKHVEWLLLKKAYQKNELAPNKPEDNEYVERRRHSFIGGYVKEPKQGLHENIVYLDFKSLYPSIIVEHNICPTTLEEKKEEPPHKFSQEEEGFIPEILKNLIKQRTQIKKQMNQSGRSQQKYKRLNYRQRALKLLSNSVAPETPIVVKDPDDILKVISIENIYNKISSKELEEGSSKYKKVSGWKALSVKEDQAVFKPIYGVSKHKPDEAYSVRTNMGEVTITGDHSVMVMEGKSDTRIRDSKFEGIEPIKGKNLSKDNVIAQVNNLKIDNENSVDELIIPEVLKGLEENFSLYIPKNLNLNKHDWYKNRIKILKSIIQGKNNSVEIQEQTDLERRAVKKTRDEGLTEKVDTTTVGNCGIVPVYSLTKLGRSYLDFYNTFKNRSETNKYYVIDLDDLDKLPPKEILEESSVANTSSKARNKIPAIINIDEEFTSLLGWYVAEGHVHEHNGEDSSYVSSAISSYDSEIKKEVKKLFQSVFNYDSRISNNQVRCGTSTISRIFSELCGRRADEKKVPDLIFNCEKKFRKKFLESYTKGDGDSDGRRLSTNSRKLKSQLSFLLKEGDCIVHNGYDTGVHRISRRTKTQGEKIVSGDLYGQKPKSIKKVNPPENVYDLSIKDTENFVTAEGIVLHNSFFGYLGYPAARWYSRESAESVTAYGRDYIDETIKDIEDKGFDVLYADTDGFYAVLPDADKDETKERTEKFLDYINDELLGMLKLEYEGFYRRGLFVTKKKYAVIDEDDYITTKGLEIERRDWSLISKETQKNVLKALLRDGSVEEAAEVVREVVEKLKNYEIPKEKLVIMKQLTKKPDKYKSKGPHVQIAERMQKRGQEVKPGTVISYLVTEGTGNVGDRSKTMEKFEESTKNYDSDYYIDKQVIPAVSRILKTFGYQKEDLKHDQTGLDEWM